MNDDFMHALQKAPPHAFSRRLYRRIAGQSAGQGAGLDSEATHPAPRTGLRLPTARQLGLGLAAICLALALTFAISPAARARINDVLNSVGGLIFSETTLYPGGSGPERTFPEQTVTAEQAAGMLPFSFNLPEWAPPGFVFEADRVVVMNDPNEALNYVRLGWQNQAAGAALHLTLTWWPGEEQSNGYVIGPDSLEEVSVNGQPAAIVRGAWNVDTEEWSGANLIALHWERDGITYHLDGAESAVTVEDLVRMAESVH